LAIDNYLQTAELQEKLDNYLKSLKPEEDLNNNAVTKGQDNPVNPDIKSKKERTSPLDDSSSETITDDFEESVQGQKTICDENVPTEVIEQIFYKWEKKKSGKKKGN
jgi:hypothetical protein